MCEVDRITKPPLCIMQCIITYIMIQESDTVSIKDKHDVNTIIFVTMLYYQFPSFVQRRAF